MGVALCILAFIAPIAVMHLRWKRRLARINAKRDAAWRREDAAWQAWCTAASSAIGEHRSVPNVEGSVMTDETAKREGKRIECAACWAHPRTPRLCYCDEPQPPRERPVTARTKDKTP